MKKLILLLTLACMPIFAWAALTSPEQTIATSVQQNNEAMLALLEQVVNINSGTTNINGVKQVGAIFQQQLNALGFKTYWAQEPAALNRAPALIAEHIGTAGKRILLIGHLDTVFAPDSSFNHYTIAGKWMHGPGTIDMKGGDVVMLAAVKALQQAGALNNATIRIYLAGDEENSGKPTAISRKPLYDLARESDVALDFECAFNLGTATVARRGVSGWKITTHGRETHSAKIFNSKTGDGAIFELARILNALRTELSTQPHISFNPGVIYGGTETHYNSKTATATAFGKTNVVSGIAIARGDLRFASLAQEAALRQQMQSIVTTQNLPHTTAKITFQDGIPAMPVTPNNLALLAQYSDVSQALGFGPVNPLDADLRGAGDISFIAALVSANLAGIGPVGYGAHSTRETLDMTSMLPISQRAALLMYRLSR